MKKIIAIMLMLTIMLGLAACGTGEVTNTEVVTTSSVASTIEEATLNNKYTVPRGDTELEFVLEDVYFADELDLNDEGYLQPLKDGNVFVCVKYSFKNIGKKITNSPRNFLKLNYSDGYEFDAEKTYFFASDCWNKEMTKQGVWVGNADELEVLSDATECITWFSVPMEVKDNTEAPLSLNISLNDGMVYTIR